MATDWWAVTPQPGAYPGIYSINTGFRRDLTEDPDIKEIIEKLPQEE